MISAFVRKVYGFIIYRCGYIWIYILICMLYILICTSFPYTSRTNAAMGAARVWGLHVLFKKKKEATLTPVCTNMRACVCV